jgi:hypothetical protein
MNLHRSAFIKAMRDEFPGVASWLNGYRDNLTLEILRFRQFTEDAIVRGDLPLVRKCFIFANKAFSTGNRHVRNALIVTYLEHLEFVGLNGASAEKLLPAPLAVERERMRTILAPLAELPRKKKRSKRAT